MSKVTNNADEKLGPEQIRRGQRRLLIEGAFSAGMAASLSGLFLTGLVVKLGGQAQHVAWMQSALLLGGVFQVATNSILNRVGSRKRFCLVALAVVRLTRAAMAVLPSVTLLGVDPSRLLQPLGILMLLGGVFGMSAEVVRQSWIADLVPTSVRGRFLGRRVQITAAVTAVVIPAYAWLVAAWQASGHDALIAFQIVIGIGVGSGLASLWCIGRVPEPPMQHETTATSLLKSLQLPLRHEQYRRFIALHGSFSFATGVCGGFFHLFMLQYLGMSYILIAATDLVSHLVGILAAPHWGTLADRWGTKRMLTTALVAKTIFPFLWLGVSPQWWYIVFVVILVRMFNTAQEIGFVNLGLQLAPRQDRAAYIAMEHSFNNVARAAAPALAGALAAAIGDRVWSVAATPWTALHVLIVLSGVMRLASLVLLRGIRHPDQRGAKQRPKTG